MQNIVFNLKLNSKEFAKSAKGVDDALDGTKKKVKGVGDEAKKTGTKIKDTEKDVKGLGASLGKLGAAALAAFSVGAIISFGKEMTKVSAEMESLRIRLNGLYGSQQKAGSVFSELGFMANKYGIELKTLTENYASFVAGAKASGMELGKAENIFKSMTIAIQGSGANAETAKRAFTALTQMIGKGKIQAEELRGQLGEAMPAAFGIMAKSMGVTTQELDKMMASGNLIASEVLPKFAEEMENAFGENATKLASGLQADLARLENTWTSLYLTASNSGASVASVKAITGLVQGLEYAIIAARGAYALLTSGFDDAKGIKALKNELSLKALSEYEGRAIDMYRRQTESYIENLKERGMSDKEITKQLISDSDAIERKISKRNDLTQEDKARTIELKAQSDSYRGAIESLIPHKQKSVSLTKEEVKEMKKLRAEVEATRRRAILAEKTDVGKIKQKAEFEVEDLQDNPAFLALTEKEQTAILNEIDNQTNEQVEKLIEAKGKGLEKLKAYEKSVESEDESGGLIAKIVAGVGGEMGKELDDLKDIEKQKQAYRIEMAMQTFDLLSALNARYTQGQTEQLNQQLQQGLISQQAYEEQMLKIKRRQAVIDKAGALFQIGVNTAVALSNPSNLATFGALSPLILALGGLQAATVIASPIPYNKGTKRVPFARGAVRGKDSVHAILTPNERVVPESVNMQPGYSALMDLAQDRKISDSEAGFIADLATSGYRANNQAQTASIDYDLLGRSIAKYFPGTDVKIDKNGIAVISERHAKELKRRTSKL